MSSRWARRYVRNLRENRALPKTNAELAECITRAQLNALKAFEAALVDAMDASYAGLHKRMAAYYDKKLGGGK